MIENLRIKNKYFTKYYNLRICILRFKSIIYKYFYLNLLLKYKFNLKFKSNF